MASPDSPTTEWRRRLACGFWRCPAARMVITAARDALAHPQARRLRYAAKQRQAHGRGQTEFKAARPKTPVVVTHCQPGPCRSVTWKTMRVPAFVGNHRLPRQPCRSDHGVQHLIHTIAVCFLSFLADSAVQKAHDCWKPWNAYACRSD